MSFITSLLSTHPLQKTGRHSSLLGDLLEAGGSGPCTHPLVTSSHPHLGNSINPPPHRLATPSPSTHHPIIPSSHHPIIPPHPLRQPTLATHFLHPSISHSTPSDGVNPPSSPFLSTPSSTLLSTLLHLSTPFLVLHPCVGDVARVASSSETFRRRATQPGRQYYARAFSLPHTLTTSRHFLPHPLPITSTLTPPRPPPYYNRSHA